MNTPPPGRPLLFLDVDGPLLPFGAGARTGGGAPVPDGENPLLGRLDPTAGPRLLALGCELVWATTWGDEANETVAPRIGLPRLPVLEWPEGPAHGVPRGVHTKTPHVVARAAGRPFIWVDDEITDLDRLWVGGRHPGRSLLYRVAPETGLTAADFAVLDAWLTAARPR
ncbi:HAD domain-containing protein [Streptomyces thermolilacinus]